jgi:hypothetical protein
MRRRRRQTSTPEKTAREEEKKSMPSSATVLFAASMLTSLFALLICIYTIANASYPAFLRRDEKSGMLLPATVYVAITIAAAITIWESWKNKF